MPVRWYTVVVDCRDPAAQARWWGEVLDWPVVYEDEEEVVIAPRHALDDERTPWEQRATGLCFVSAPEDKTVKNRLHMDVAPPKDVAQEDEVARLVELGASHVDIGQGERSWVVLADPEGNEFCVLSPRD
jgi:catechol 2,3-dioxygenase-like lactoylglutathione lyase family enzyme